MQVRAVLSIAPHLDVENPSGRGENSGMRWAAIALLTISGAFTGAACGGDTERIPEHTEDDLSFIAAPGSTFAVLLEANPELGEEWVLESNPDPAIVRLVDSKVLADPPERLPGQPAATRFTFLADSGRASFPDSNVALVFTKRSCTGETSGSECQTLDTKTFTASVELGE